MAIYRITLTETNACTAYVHADSPEEAETKAETIREHDAGAFATEWGADELDSALEVAREPLSTPEADYRGDPRKIADKNEEAYTTACEDASE